LVTSMRTRSMMFSRFCKQIKGQGSAKGQRKGSKKVKVSGEKGNIVIDRGMVQM